MGSRRELENLYAPYRPLLRCQARLRQYRRPSTGRVAVCLVGQARTFDTDPMVESSFKRHLLLPLATNGTAVDVFVRVKSKRQNATAERMQTLDGLEHLFS